MARKNAVSKATTHAMGGSPYRNDRNDP